MGGVPRWAWRDGHLHREMFSLLRKNRRLVNIITVTTRCHSIQARRQTERRLVLLYHMPLYDTWYKLSISRGVLIVGPNRYVRIPL